MGLSDYRFALEFRAELARLVREEVDKQRPRHQVAEVVSIDRVLRRCVVEFPGDTTTATVSMGSIQPASVGQLVRIEGVAGDRYIADVMGAPYEPLETRVASIEAQPGESSNLILNGGFEYGSAQHWSTFWSSGSITHGIDTNSGNAESGAYSYATVMTATDANLVLQNTVYPCEPGQVISFSYTQKKTGTATVFSRLEILSNTLSTNVDYFASGLSQITVLSDASATTSYVTRRALFTVPAGHYFFRPVIRAGCSAYTSSTTLHLDSLASSRILIQPPGNDPISFGGAATFNGTASFNDGLYCNNDFDVDGFKGDGWDGFRWSLRGQHLLTGGGLRTVTSTAVGWATRFIMISAGMDSGVAANGYFNIDMPIDGTVITGVGGASNQTVSSGTVTLNNWAALYYILPFGSAATSVAANFRLVYYNATYTVPNNWVLIAVRNGDNGDVKWGDGRTQDYWRTVTYTNSWVSYGSPYIGAQYKKENGIVRLRGLVTDGTFSTTSTGNIFTLPAGFRPGGQNIVTTMSNQALGRVDILTDGAVRAMFGSAGNWISLYNISFQAEG
jgi:hypothetical protein